MKVVQLTRFDSGDGVSNAAYRLHTGLLTLGIESLMFVEEEIRSKFDDPTVKRFQPSRSLGSRVRRRLRRMQIAGSLARYRATRPNRDEIFSDDRAPYGGDLPAQLPEADIVHVHAMYQFVDYRGFFAAVPRHTPVVRTLHDISFITGGCHGPGACTKYTERCGACPKLGSRNANDLSRQIWLRKRRALQSVPSNRLHVVAPSRWLAHEAMRSGLLHDLSVPVSVIPLGLDTEVFQPRDKGFARQVIGIPPDAEVVLFVADMISNPMKGFAVLAEAVNGLQRPGKLLLLSAGSGTATAEVRVPYLSLGSVGNGRLLSLVYSAADLLVVPCLRGHSENFPQVALEAMACGTPVVASDVGGIPDMVRPSVSGLLFPAHDVSALRTAIEEMLEDRVGRTAMAANCRRIVLENYSLELYARRHAELYHALLAAQAPQPVAPEDLDHEH